MHLERALTDANRQLLERDDELIRIARDKELLAARKTLQAYEEQLHRFQDDIEHLNRRLRRCRRRRAWRFAVWVRERRPRPLRLLPGGG